MGIQDEASAAAGARSPRPSSPAESAASTTVSDKSGGSSSSASAPSSGSRTPTAAGAEPADVRDTDLNHYHAMARFDELVSKGQFSKVRSISDCCAGGGQVEVHRWRDGAEKVAVVKRVQAARVRANVGKEANEHVVHASAFAKGGQGKGGLRSCEDMLTEIGVYCYLGSQPEPSEYLLRMHAVFEAGSDVWLVLEHADDGDLFNAVKAMHDGGARVEQHMPQVARWTWQLMQAVRHLHSLGVGHRDISPENVLLRGGAVRLMDFGQAVELRTPQGRPRRYFSPAGKHLYRAPECYVPADAKVQAQVPPRARAGEPVLARVGSLLCEVAFLGGAPLLPGQVAAAEPSGYSVAPADVFSCGVCLFVMVQGVPPWKKAVLADPHFAWAHQNGGVAQLLKAWGTVLPADLADLMTSMLLVDPSQRPAADDCVSHALFASFQSEAGRAEAVGEPVGECTPGMPGDFYHQAEAVRSASDGPCGCRDAPLDAQARRELAAMAGDFYCPIDDVTRSNDCPDEHVPPAPAPLFDFSCAPLPRPRAGAPSSGRFPEGAAAPRLPTGLGFQLAPTTARVDGGCSAAEVANYLLDLLDAEPGASVRGVDCERWQIEASVDSCAGSCQLRVHLYADEGGQIAVEFQRRSGDSSALHLVHCQALRYLGELASALDRSAEAPARSPSGDSDGDASAGSSSPHRLARRVGPGVRGLLRRRRDSPASVSPPSTPPQEAARRPPACRLPRSVRAA